MTGELVVEVAIAWPDRQALVTVRVSPGSTAVDAIRDSGIEQDFADRLPPNLAIGIWGHPVTADHVVADGDRIEIYRPLVADPREARRELAAQGRTMGMPAGVRGGSARDRR